MFGDSTGESLMQAFDRLEVAEMTAMHLSWENPSAVSVNIRLPNIDELRRVFFSK